MDAESKENKFMELEPGQVWERFIDEGPDEGPFIIVLLWENDKRQWTVAEFPNYVSTGRVGTFWHEDMIRSFTYVGSVRPKVKYLGRLGDLKKHTEVAERYLTKKRTKSLMRFLFSFLFGIAVAWVWFWGWLNAGIPIWLLLFCLGPFFLIICIALGIFSLRYYD